MTSGGAGRGLRGPHRARRRGGLPGPSGRPRAGTPRSPRAAPLQEKRSGRRPGLAASSLAAPRGWDSGILRDPKLWQASTAFAKSRRGRKGGLRSSQEDLSKVQTPKRAHAPGFMGSSLTNQFFLPALCPAPFQVWAPAQTRTLVFS